MELREKKPLVVSIGEMAASGGYFMACTGTKIYAEPGSIVGSIGVVGGKVAVGRTLEQIGVHAQTFPAAKKPVAAARATYPSLFDEWDDPTKERVLESMKSIYDLFLARVAEGRRTSVEKVAPWAEGRIWSGRQGKEHGLVDELGGLGAAIAKARELASLPADADVETVGGPGGMVERFLGVNALPIGAESRGLEGGVARGVLRAVPGLPAFVGSLWPLVRGERALTALPYALVVR